MSKVKLDKNIKYKQVVSLHSNFTRTLQRLWPLFCWDQKLLQAFHSLAIATDMLFRSPFYCGHSSIEIIQLLRSLYYFKHSTLVTTSHCNWSAF